MIVSNGKTSDRKCEGWMYDCGLKLERSDRNLKMKVGFWPFGVFRKDGKSCDVS